MYKQGYENAEEFARKYKKETCSQKELIIDYLLRYGSITPLEALQAFGCFRLGARIWDLRHEGWNIVAERAEDANYSVYKLGEEQ